MFWPPFCARTAGPTHCPPESFVEVSWIWDDWSLVYGSATRMAPAVALVPTTACEEIESAPSLIATQFDPSEPLGRLKSSDGAVADAAWADRIRRITAKRTSARSAEVALTVERLATLGSDSPPIGSWTSVVKSLNLRGLPTARDASQARRWQRSLAVAKPPST